MSKVTPETAAVIIGSFGKDKRLIYRKLGHNVGRFVIIGATTHLGQASNPKETEVIVGERKNGMNGINDGMISRKSRVVRFWSKGLLIV